MTNTAVLDAAGLPGQVCQPKLTVCRANTKVRTSIPQKNMMRPASCTFGLAAKAYISSPMTAMMRGMMAISMDDTPSRTTPKPKRRSKKQKREAQELYETALMLIYKYQPKRWSELEHIFYRAGMELKERDLG